MVKQGTLKNHNFQSTKQWSFNKADEAASFLFDEWFLFHPAENASWSTHYSKCHQFSLWILVKLFSILSVYFC